MRRHTPRLMSMGHKNAVLLTCSTAEIALRSSSEYFLSACRSLREIPFRFRSRFVSSESRFRSSLLHSSV